MKISGIKCILFDLDGTLIDSSEGVIKATNYALGEMGEPLRSMEEIRKYIGFPLEDMFKDFSDKPYEEFWKFFRLKAKEVIVDSAVALEGASKTLEYLHNKGFRLAIGSTKISPHIIGTLDKMNWSRFIEAIVGADMVENVKPAPDVFLKLIGMMKAEKENCVVVGDTINDILSAKSAGLKSVAVRSPYGGEDVIKKCDPDIYINNIAEIIGLIEH